MTKLGQVKMTSEKELNMDGCQASPLTKVVWQASSVASTQHPEERPGQRVDHRQSVTGDGQMQAQTHLPA